MKIKDIRTFEQSKNSNINVFEYSFDKQTLLHKNFNKTITKNK